MTVSYTSHFRFGIPDFLSGPWHNEWHTLVTDIDRVLYSMLVSGGLVIWKNSTAYAIGVLAFDPLTTNVYRALVAHTSAASPTTLAQDIVAHPSYWELFAFSSIGAPATRIVTTDVVAVTINDDFVVLNKPIAATTTISLPSVTTRSGRPVTIIDWAGNAGDIVITPDGAESIMGRANWTVTSTGGAGAGGKIELYPNEILNGWLVRIG